MYEARKELDQRIKAIDDDIAYLGKKCAEAKKEARETHQRLLNSMALRAQYVRLQEAAESL